MAYNTKRFILTKTLRDLYDSKETDEIEEDEIKTKEEYHKWKTSPSKTKKPKPVKQKKISTPKISNRAKQCEGHTLKLVQCKNVTKNSSGYCYLHT